MAQVLNLLIVSYISAARGLSLINVTKF